MQLQQRGGKEGCSQLLASLRVEDRRAFNTGGMHREAAELEGQCWETTEADLATAVPAGDQPEQTEHHCAKDKQAGSCPPQAAAHLARLLSRAARQSSSAEYRPPLVSGWPAASSCCRPLRRSPTNEGRLSRTWRGESEEKAWQI